MINIKSIVNLCSNPEYVDFRKSDVRFQEPSIFQSGAIISTGLYCRRNLHLHGRRGGSLAFLEWNEHDVVAPHAMSKLQPSLECFGSFSRQPKSIGDLQQWRTRGVKGEGVENILSGAVPYSDPIHHNRLNFRRQSRRCIFSLQDKRDETYLPSAAAVSTFFLLFTLKQ